MRRRVRRLPAGWPSTHASPDVGASRPSSSFTAVVLPAPFGPRKPKISPRGTVIESPASATVPLKRLVSSTVWIAGEIDEATAPEGAAASFSATPATRAGYTLRRGPGNRRRIFGAHATHLRVRLLRCSLTQLSNALATLLVASPASRPPGSPNLSTRSPSVTLVVLGVSRPDNLDHDVEVFEAAGFRRLRDMATLPEGDAVLGVAGGGAELLRDADRIGLKYVLVHEGASDGHSGGTYERAHHRVEAGELQELAQHLRSRKRPLITCLAFGYKNGAPSDAALLIDARFLDNPYWIPELRERTGHDPAVAKFVMSQPAATRLLDDLHRMVTDLMPLYHEKGRTHLVVAFGCTGGRHRSVVLASEMANRLRAIDGIDVDFVTRDL